MSFVSRREAVAQKLRSSIRVDRFTKDAIAELRKGSSMLTQDSINLAIREANVRIGCVDSLEYIPQQRMVEASHINFTVKGEMQIQEVDFRFAALRRACAVDKGDLPKLFGEAALVPMGFVTAHTNKVCEVTIADAKECRQVF